MSGTIRNQTSLALAILDERRMEMSDETVEEVLQERSTYSFELLSRRNGAKAAAVCCSSSLSRSTSRQ